MLNHKLTENQEKELKEVFKSEKTVVAPSDLSWAWSAIKTDFELDYELLKEVENWISTNSEKGDCIILQGEFGHSFYLIDYCLKHELVPLHAVTEHVENLVKNGEKIERKLVFEHKCFRKYEYSKE